MTVNPGDTPNNDHYRILRQLGRGGFGFVYLAQDTLLGEQVAIKELIPALVGDEGTLKRFLAEARATMRLRHERIVATHSVFTEGGNYYIVMECMAGDSLEARLRERGSLPVDEAVRIAAEVCEGLAYAHERGVVHCDLKPHNILFDANGRAKVADFGIAHVSGEMLTRSWKTPAGFVAGTLPYMSPEQADGVRDDPRIDVYAVGAVLYRMLTGRPYLEFDQRETPGAQADNVYRIRNQDPQPPSAHVPGSPVWVDGVVLRALAKQSAKRYASAEAMRAALLHRQPAPATAPAARMSRRHGHVSPLVGVLAAMALVSVLTAAGLGAWWLMRDEPQVTTVTVVATTAAPAETQTPEPSPSVGEEATSSVPVTTGTGEASAQPLATDGSPQPPTATLAPTPYPAAVLVAPVPGQELNGRVLFQWQWDHAPLAGNEYFDLRIWSEVEEMVGDEPRGVVAPLKESQAQVDLEGVWSIQEYRDQTQRYYWAVVVVRKPCPACRIEVVGQWSEERLFLYTGP
jgi:hypothetical protein